MGLMFDHRVKPYLKTKDGFTHVVMLDIIDDSNGGAFECQREFTRDLDGVIVDMQKVGYQIIDIKTEKRRKGFNEDTEYFNILIIYK